MNNTFLNLPEEKKNRIINASIDEFSKYGFDRASTNRIVKMANIGKGMLFYYFESKKKLYIFIIDIIIEKFIKNVKSFIDKCDNDLFNRILEWNKYKLKIFNEKPYMFKMIMGIVSEQNPEVKEVVEEKYNLVTKKTYKMFVENIDLSNFRDDIDIDKAVDIIIWVSNAYIRQSINKYKDKLNDFDFFSSSIIQESDEYLELLKKLMCRNSNL